MLDGYLSLFFGFVTVAIIAYLLLSFLLKNKGTDFIRHSSYLFFFLSLFLVIFCTIILFGLPISFNPDHYILNLKPLLWLEDEFVRQRIMNEIIPNIVVFIPLGIFTPIAFKQMRKWFRAALFACLVPFCIEFFQYFIGRSSDIDDFIANFLGIIIGYVIFKIFCALFKNKTWWMRFIGASHAQAKE
jgi:glycopeptide antibiotics resistance protein